MCEKARLKNGHARLDTRVLKNAKRVKKKSEASLHWKTACRGVSKNARVEKMLLNSKHSYLQWNAGTACVSECMLKTLGCRGLRVCPSFWAEGPIPIV